jgi:hypothetical protein
MLLSFAHNHQRTSRKILLVSRATNKQNTQSISSSQHTQKADWETFLSLMAREYVEMQRKIM